MQDIKTLEKDLNTLNDIRDSIKLLIDAAENHKGKINILEFALSGCTEKEKDILTRICINSESIDTVASAYNVSERQIYNWKKKALKSLLRRLYGDVKIMEGDINVD